jgi:hypothetical protein
VSASARIVFTFDEDDNVQVFWSLADAEGWIEGIDVSEGVYTDVFLEDGEVVALTGGPDVDVAARLTSRHDLDRLRERLRSVGGPRHLADDPRAYAYE